MNLTENALKEVKKVIESQKLDINSTFLKVEIKGINCSGVNYGISFTNEIKEDDIKSKFDELTVITDPKSSIMLEDVIIDFYDQEDARGFIFKDPNESPKGCGGCGCKCG